MKKRINITMEQHILDTVDQLAKERGIDRSTMISILIYDAANIIEARNENGTDDALVHFLGEL